MRPVYLRDVMIHFVYNVHMYLCALRLSVWQWVPYNWRKLNKLAWKLWRSRSQYAINTCMIAVGGERLGQWNCVRACELMKVLYMLKLDRMVILALFQLVPIIVCVWFFIRTSCASLAVSGRYNERKAKRDERTIHRHTHTSSISSIHKYHFMHNKNEKKKIKQKTE